MWYVAWVQSFAFVIVWDTKLMNSFCRKLGILVYVSIALENCEMNWALYGFFHRDTKGKTCCLELYFSCPGDLWSSQPFLRENTFLPHEPKRVSPVAMASLLLYTSQNLLCPSRPLSLLGLADLLLLLSETFNYQQHFFNHYEAYYGQLRHYGWPGTASPPL